MTSESGTVVQEDEGTADLRRRHEHILPQMDGCGNRSVIVRLGPHDADKTTFRFRVVEEKPLADIERLRAEIEFLRTKPDKDKEDEKKLTDKEALLQVLDEKRVKCELEGQVSISNCNHGNASSATDKPGVPSVLRPRDRTILGAAVAVLVAQMLLATDIELHFKVANDLTNKYLKPFVGMLYTARLYSEIVDAQELDDSSLNWSEQEATAAFARIDGRPTVKERSVFKPYGPETSSESGSLVLLSGGIDSALAASSLLAEVSKKRAKKKTTGIAGKQEDDVIHFIHFVINTDSSSIELEAATGVVDHLRKKYGAAVGSFFVVNVDITDLVLLGRRYSDVFGQAWSNTIPHGRDLLLLLIAAIVARTNTIGQLVTGYEKDSIEKDVHIMSAKPAFLGSRVIARHDFESVPWGGQLEACIDEYVAKGMTVFKPLADKSLYDIRREMVQDHKDLLRVTNSCFWGEYCERCAKCVSLFALQEALDNRPVRFASNPLNDPTLGLLQDICKPPEVAGMQQAPEMLAYGDLIMRSLSELRQKDYAKDWYWVKKYSS